MRNLLALSLEEIEAEKTEITTPTPPVEKPKGEREDELVFYCKITNPDGLRLAADKEKHEQWEIKKHKGRVRVRKTSKEGLEPTYTLTFKTKSTNAGIDGNIEDNNDTNEGVFNGFKNIADEGMIKDRYKFPVGKIEITTDSGRQDVDIVDVFYEVDVFFKEDGSLCEYVKIDLEMNKILDEVNKVLPSGSMFNLNVRLMGLPFKPSEVIISDKNTTEEEKQQITQLYNDHFLSKK